MRTQRRTGDLRCGAKVSLAALRFLAAFVALAGSSLCEADSILVSPDRTNGVYQVGDTVEWRIERRGEALEARYTVKRGGWTVIEDGDLQFTGGSARLETPFEQPGTVLLEVKWKDKDGEPYKSVGGAVCAPDQIGLAVPPPDDFREFWNARLQELEAVPVNARLKEVEIEKPDVDYWHITMDNIRGTSIHGQIARPSRDGKFPALLIVQWAGVYPLEKGWVTARAANGWLALNIIAHDLPIDRPGSFYKRQAEGPLRDYWSIGNDNRETSYFLRMYLSCYRAAEYLRGRPDWDGETLVVMGGSQGGLQALMTAGLHPGITAALAIVPAGCDMLGPEAGRAPGWPHWYSNTAGKDADNVRQASRYYDVANSTPMIQCPVLVGIGLLDEVCPPAGIFAAVNQITSPKEIIVLPKGAHQDEQESHSAYYRRCYDTWLPALREGAPAPVPAAE